MLKHVQAGFDLQTLATWLHWLWRCARQTALERQDLSRTYLAHHESVVIIIIITGAYKTCHLSACKFSMPSQQAQTRPHVHPYYCIHALICIRSDPKTPRLA